MVGRHPQSFQSTYLNGNSKADDLESAITATRRKPKFRDIVNLASHDNYHAQLKTKLKEGLDRDGLEKYRKSVEDIKAIKNKKVRRFYEEQNERLNDWLEVDTLVMAMADDVMDSMNPRDMDGDGVVERVGALQVNKDSIDSILPEDEREKRKKGERNAKLAINVNFPIC